MLEVLPESTPHREISSLGHSNRSQHLSGPILKAIRTLAFRAHLRHCTRVDWIDNIHRYLPRAPRHRSFHIGDHVEAVFRPVSMDAMTWIFGAARRRLEDDFPRRNINVRRLLALTIGCAKTGCPIRRRSSRMMISDTKLLTLWADIEALQGIFSIYCIQKDFMGPWPISMSLLVPFAASFRLLSSAEE